MKRLYRDRWDKKIGGVCGGLGRYLRLDPTLLRLAVVLACILTAFIPFIALYLIAWIAIPQGPITYVQFRCKKLYRSTQDRKIAGVCGGLAKFLQVNSTLVRLLTFIALVLTGFFPVLILYLAASFIVPEKV